MVSITLMNEIYQEDIGDRRERFKESAIKTLVIVGLIVILAMGAYGSVQVFRSAPNLFSLLGAAVVNITSLFIPAGGDATPIVPDQTESATPATTISTPSTQTNTNTFIHSRKL